MDFIPQREAELVTWSTTFDEGITAHGTAVGISVTQSAAFHAVNQIWVDAYQVANNALTRSPANIIAKDQARVNMVAMARQLAAIVQAFPATTDALRAQLGLTVEAQRQPVPPPGFAPHIDVLSVSGHKVSIRIHDGSGSRRGRPAGIDGASVFSFVGETAPTDVSKWKFEGSVTRLRCDVAFDAALPPGTKVWLTAFFFNPRMESGPACEPVGTQIQFGGMSNVV